MNRSFLLIASFLLLSSVAVHAEIIKTIGEGKALIIKKDQNLTRNQALNNAREDAVTAMIIKINGPQSLADAKPFLSQIVKQVDPSYYVNLGSQTDAEQNLVTRISLEMDDQEFRSILNDYGLSKKNSRTSPIMVVMDEYFGVPRDNSKPVKEFTAYYNDQSYKHNEDAKYKSNESASASSKESASSRSRASSGYAGAYDNYYGAGAYAGGSSRSNSNKYAAASSSKYNASESASYSQNEQQNDIQSFVRYVEYQTPSTQPESVNQTLNSIAQNAAKYDLRLMDSDLFRSKYLKGRHMSVQQLLSDSELAKFAAAARQEKADWFMAGSSNIFDRGRSPVTGQYACDGAVSFKVYSVDDATLMTGETRTESASGATAEACRTNVAAKLGQLALSTIGPQILNYSKNRSMYGKDMTIFVKSTSNNVSTRLGDDLFVALEDIQGADNINIRTQDGHLVEITMTYKGNKPITVELAKALRSSPVLAAAERKQEGNTLTLCIGGTQCK
ncbi:hypothetical protein F975_00999 [Acinetobacter sp. ANC 3789]|uniref:hypothetical protein n=1 Tax=Acinetobacter sp. ANC 3789 TaxID=1217714 RepID=UPI0002CEB715|nr:hypothetical protein [Acinetobacter sp. ANC 3789]ENU81138.1 hypothetical protein F975_00999 [Acinetobacter sp. ANC 3789]